MLARNSRQYGLKRIFVGFTIVCSLFAIVNRQIDLDRKEREAVKRLTRLGGWVHHRLRYRLPVRSEEGQQDPQLLGDRTVIVASLVGDAFDDRICSSLRCLRNLQRLYLDQTKVTDAALEELGRLRHLERLSLSGTPIRGSGLKHLSRAARLQELNLSETPISDQSIEHLIRIPGLRKLVIYNTRISRRGIVRLRHACPSLKVFA